MTSSKAYLSFMAWLSTYIADNKKQADTTIIEVKEAATTTIEIKEKMDIDSIKEKKKKMDIDTIE